MFLKEVMILFHAKREKKAEKEDQTQAGQTSRSATEVQSLPPKKSQVPPQKKTVAVEPVITISLPDVGCLSIRQFAGTRCNHGRRKVNNWTIGFPVPSSAVCYGSTEQGSFIHHIGEGSHGLRVCSHQAETIFVPVEKSICYSVDCRDPDWHEQAQGCSHDLF